MSCFVHRDSSDILMSHTISMLQYVVASWIFPFFFSSFYFRTSAFLHVNLASPAPSAKLFVTWLVTVVYTNTSKLTKSGAVSSHGRCCCTKVTASQLPEAGEWPVPASLVNWHLAHLLCWHYPAVKLVQNSSSMDRSCVSSYCKLIVLCEADIHCYSFLISSARLCRREAQHGLLLLLAQVMALWISS